MARHRPILLAGPTASGKSALALGLADALDGMIINADALQVYDCWQVLTARPDAADLAKAPHRLYGHLRHDAPYSVGAWLRDIAPLLDTPAQTPIIVGGTGLYLTALTEGLADIPAVPAEVRARGNALRATSGAAAFVEILQKQDPQTLARLDPMNPVRLQRAWEVLTTTGQGLAQWQDQASPPLLPLTHCDSYVINVETSTLNARISQRFDRMLADGALNEARAALQRGWNPALASSRAIGAAELVGVAEGSREFAEAIAAAKLASRQYAKRQRSWFRNRMAHWTQLSVTSEPERAAALARIIAE